GKVVLIHYWATMGSQWKGDEILLRDLYAKKGGNGGEFEIIGVCLDDDPTEAKQYVAENKIPWKQVYERGGLDGRLANEMGVLTLLFAFGNFSHEFALQVDRHIGFVAKLLISILHGTAPGGGQIHQQDLMLRG